MHLNCYILLTLMLLSFSSVNVEAHFESRNEFYKEIHRAGFGYIVEVPFSRQMKVKILKGDGDFNMKRVDQYIEGFDVEYLERLNFREAPSKPMTYAYRVGDTMVCYIEQYFSLMSGKYLQEREFSSCLVFPYKVSDVLNSIIRG